MQPSDLRAACRNGGFTAGTSGWCEGFVQANLIALPRRHADDFRRFCDLNPRPCPLIGVSPGPILGPGAPAPGADLRTDLPRYRILRGEAPPEEAASVVDRWRPDLTAFLLGCSFGFEAALVRAGIRLRHQEENRVVPMYITDRACVAAGPFAGPLVVSMRPIGIGEVEAATRISGAVPLAHGAPVHVGNPAALGIADLARPDFGEDGGVRPGEIPVFWACGVTSQLAARRASPDLVIAHAPGHMFVTDLIAARAA